MENLFQYLAFAVVVMGATAQIAIIASLFYWFTRKVDNAEREHANLPRKKLNSKRKPKLNGVGDHEHRIERKLIERTGPEI